MEAGTPSDGTLPKGLAYFSLALGAVEVLAPKLLSRTIGLEPQPAMMRALGLREIATGIGMLSLPGSPAGPGARVAGGCRGSGSACHGLELAFRYPQKAAHRAAGGRRGDGTRRVRHPQTDPATLRGRQKPGSQPDPDRATPRSADEREQWHACAFTPLATRHSPTNGVEVIRRSKHRSCRNFTLATFRREIST